MTRLSVVGTVHAEEGLASVPWLLKILDRLHPEVIFLECPPAAIEHYFNPPRKLEAKAVLQYLQLHRADLIPVDLPTPEDDFFRRHRDLDDRLGRSGPEYGQLIHRHSRYVREYGFAYLNSEQCSELFSKLHEVTVAAIEKLADPALADSYELWISTNKARDKSIIEKIEKFCSETSIKRAVLLVGAAHRQSIFELTRRQPGADSRAVQWDFAGFLDQLD